MLARWIRTWDSRLFRPFLRIVAGHGISPNTITLFSLIAAILAALTIASGHKNIGAVVLLFAGLLDSMDGELARLTGSDTRFGSFLDSICDHLGDFSVYLGLLWFSVEMSLKIEVWLIFVALFGSVFGSLVRSRASMSGIDPKNIGVFTRTERMIVLILGLLTNMLLPALWVLAVFNNFSALQRVVYTVRRAHRAELGRGQ